MFKELCKICFKINNKDIKSKYLYSKYVVLLRIFDNTKCALKYLHSSIYEKNKYIKISNYNTFINLTTVKEKHFLKEEMNI